MLKETNLKSYIKEYARKCIREYLEEDEEVVDEMSTTGGVGAISTPMAFQGNKKKNVERKRRMAQQLGYKLTKQGELDVKRSADSLYSEQVEKYLNSVFSLTENVTAELVKTPKPHQKIGKAISEIHKQLKQIECALVRQRKYKVKEGVKSGQLWKRTVSNLGKLESRLHAIAHEIRELKQ